MIWAEDFFVPDLGPEIDDELDRRLARLRKGLGLDHGADPDVDLQEVVEEI